MPERHFGFAAGDRLGCSGRYVLGELLGVGGFSEVWRAKDSQMENRQVVLKIIPSPLSKFGLDQARTKELVDREVRLRNQVGGTVRTPVLHTREFAPNVGWILDMEYVPGETLAAQIDSRLKGSSFGSGPPPLSAVWRDYQSAKWHRVSEILEAHRPKEMELVAVVERVLKAAQIVSQLHKHKVLHLDLTPANILISKNGDVYLLDFGISRDLTPAGTATTGVANFGNPYYASPEHQTGQALTVRSDVFSLGAVLYHALALIPPFVRVMPQNGSYQADCPWEDREGRYVPLDQVGGDLDSALCDIVSRALKWEPDDRYQSCDELAEALSNWIAAERGIPQVLPVADVAAAMGDIGSLLREKPQGTNFAPGDVKLPVALPLVRHGLLIPRNGKYELAGFADRSGTSPRSGDWRWVEQAAAGAIAPLLVEPFAMDQGVVAVDGGATTLWALRAFIFRDLGGRIRPHRICTNNLRALAETRELPLGCEWEMFGGVRRNQRATIVDGVAASIGNSARRFHTVILGMNGLTVDQGGLRLGTDTGREIDIKKNLLKKCMNRALVVLDSSKLGRQPAEPLRPMDSLLGAHVSLHLVLAYPKYTDKEPGYCYRERARRYLDTLQELARSGLVQQMTLYAMPLAPLSWAEIEDVNQLEHHRCDEPAGQVVSKQIDQFQRQCDPAKAVVLDVEVAWRPGGAASAS